MLKEVTEKYSRELDGFIRELRKKLSHSEVAEDAERLLKYVEDEFFGSELAGRVEYWEICDMVRAVYLRLRSKYGILQEYLEDPAINEIMVNGAEHIFVEKNRKVQAVDNAFISAEELEGVIRMLASDVHREINEANPIVDARMPSGYRINGVLRNVALNGPALTIRKFAESMITMEELVQRKSLTEECKEDLCALTECGYNIFISGGTSSGKTTMLNALASYIHPEERVVIIEDSAELQLNHLENRVQMECRSANSIGKGADGPIDSHQPADAAGPDYRGGGAGRRGFGHDSGHEHGPFREHFHRPRKFHPGNAEPSGDHVHDGRPGAGVHGAESDCQCH